MAIDHSEKKRKAGMKAIDIHGVNDWNRLGIALIGWEFLLLFSSYYIGWYFQGIGVADSVIHTWFSLGYVDFLIASPLALLPLILYRQIAFFRIDLQKKERNFSWQAFGLFFMFAFALSLFSNIGISYLNGVLEILFHYSLEGAVSSASAYSPTLTVFLYSVVAAPICEELVFRGAVLRSLEKYGTGFAIIVSSILFGAMHGNFVQLIDASLFGIVLGIAAKRYSIGMAILLHAANNLTAEIFSQMYLFDSLILLSNVFYYLLLFGCAIGSIVYVVKHKQLIKDIFGMIVPEQNVLCLLKSPAIVLFLVVNFCYMFSGLISV